MEYYEDIVQRQCEYLLNIGDGDESSVSFDTIDEESENQDNVESQSKCVYFHISHKINICVSIASIATTRGRRNVPRKDYTIYG